MPKIIRIINRFNLGGPTYNAAYLSKYMAPEFETLLVGGSIDKSEENSEYIVRDLGLKPLIIPEMKRSISPQYDLIAYKKIKQIISDFHPDIVHTHASKAGALGRLAAFSMNVPVIIHTFHGHVFDAYFNKLSSAFYINIERYLAKKSSKIIAISDIQKDDLENKYKICDGNKIKVISLGFDLSRFQENITIKRTSFRSEYQIAEDEIAIAIIGRLVPIKNHSLFLEAVKYVAERTKMKIRIFIVGDGESKINIQNKASELNLSFTENKKESKNNLITFTSWIKDIDIVIAGVEIIALTSLSEGTPVSLIEAQAGNKPIVSTNVGGIENVVLPNETSLLSPNGDVETFAKNLLILVNNENLREKMSEKGWLFVKDKFHFTRLVKDTKDLYYSLLKTKN
ncbi:MAG: glycosyltransferase family 4 protein [Bacteroidetes bacterium]|nr:glycosyltransferase family 4 protein [Bacteroidota bacterium]